MQSIELDELDKGWWGIAQRGGLALFMLLARFPLPPEEVRHQQEMNEAMSKLVYRQY